MSETLLHGRGVGYDAGVLYDRTFDSRPRWSEAETRDDLRAIRTRLGCTSVLVMARDPERLLRTGRLAREEGLAVWLQPRLFDEPAETIVAAMQAFAPRAEELRIEHGEVGLVVGCELSLSTAGILPGRTFSARGSLLTVTWPLLPWANVRLRGLLRRLVDAVRPVFSGPVSYGAGEWEHPDWSLFDAVGLDLYREASNRGRFENDLRLTVARYARAGRPTIAFEFGSCTYRGAARRASQASDVLRERAGELTVPTRLVRDEQEQADYLREMLTIFDRAGIAGRHVWGFSEPRLTHAPEPGRDLDLASYGIVAPLPGGGWRPKLAFRTLAELYGGTA